MRKRNWSILIKTLQSWPSWLGAFLIGLTLFCTLIFWIGSKIALQDWFDNKWLYFSKTCALSAATLMGWLLLLTTKSLWTERLCNGLDRVYALHRILGKGTAVLLFLHPLFLSLERWPSLKDMALFFVLPYPDFSSRYAIGANIGAWTFLLLLFLLFFAYKSFNPYRKWHSIHRWMAFVYFVSLAHIVIVERDVARYPLLLSWLWFWLLLGAFSLFWTWLYPWMGPITLHEIEKIHVHGTLIDLELKSVDRPLEFKPGQWVFLKVPSLSQGKELHPFSIVSIPNEKGRLRFGIRITGKWTHHLVDAKKGDSVKVYGPYGMLSDAFLSSPRNCVLIGAGVGITPFISMWEWALHTPNRAPGQVHKPVEHSWEESLKSSKSPYVHLFYLAPSRKEAVFADSIEHIAIANQIRTNSLTSNIGHHFNLLLTPPNEPFVTLEEIEKICGSLKDKTILMCGPLKMVQAFKKQALKMGVPKEQIFYELFDWRKRPI